MHPRTRSWIPILALPLLTASIPGAAGPILGGAQPAPAARTVPPAQNESGGRGSAALTPGASIAPSGVAARRLTQEEQALLAIREEGKARVAELARRALATTDPASRLDLQRQAMEIKKQTEMRFLETKITFARSRGDLAAVHALEMQLDRLIHPPARAIPVGSDLPVKGGAR